MTDTAVIHDNMLIARQPILDLNNSLWGYALLYQAKADDGTLYDESYAAEHLLDHITNCFDLSALSSHKDVMLSVAPDTVLQHDVDALDCRHVILEWVSGDDEADPLLDISKQIKSRGIRIALCAHDQTTADPKLMQAADFITLDVKQLNNIHTQQVLRQAAQTRATLLVKNVRSIDDFSDASGLGCRLFQGNFLGRGKTIQHREIPTSDLNRLKLIQKLGEPDVSITEIESVIKHDPGMAIKLIKRINSAGMGVRNRIQSIRHAVTLLGISNLRKWITSMIVAKMGQSKPAELLRMCISRAFYCEAIGKCRTDIVGNELDYFLAGLFSQMDVILDCAKQDIFLQVKLPESVKDAVLGKANEYRQCIDLAIAHEEGNWSAITELGVQLGIGCGALAKAYSAALQEVDLVTS